MTYYCYVHERMPYVGCTQQQLIFCGKLMRDTVPVLRVWGARRTQVVDINSGELMWAVDEIVDAGHASVLLAASHFQNSSQVRALSQKTSGSATQSPRTFVKFVASSLFSTLPQR